MKIKSRRVEHRSPAHRKLAKWERAKRVLENSIMKANKAIEDQKAVVENLREELNKILLEYRAAQKEVADWEVAQVEKTEE